MQEPIDLLVNGCSFSRGPTAWPYHLDGVDVTNLACAGAGNTYIHDTTISELSKRSYDFVAVMWSGIARVDVKVNDINRFKGSAYTSQYQSANNDWPGKKICPVNDQDYIEKDWVFGCGFINQEDAMVKSKLFDQLYYYQNLRQLTYGLLINMISLQSVLKQMNVPYLFSYYNDYESELKSWPELYAMLDNANIYSSQNIYTITKNNNWYDEDGIHPGLSAHQEWARLIQPYIA
jgi:hypothetical protein